MSAVKVGPQPRSGVKVEVRNLVKIYRYKGGEVQALKGVTATFPPGVMTCVMGPSGSGKTTLLNLIGGVDIPTGGEVRVGNVHVHMLRGEHLDRFRLDNIGFVFQALNLIPSLTALENVVLPMTMAGVKRGDARAKALKLLKLVGLEGKESRYPEELSGGEQQRVAIAVALANNPPVILADEPTAELDAENARAVTNLLLRLAREEGKTVILSTHDPRVAVKADRILRLEDGKLIGEYRPLDLESMGTKEGTTQVGLAEIVKMKIVVIDREIDELTASFRRGEISIDEFYARLTRLKAVREALRELLTSIGTE